MDMMSAYKKVPVMADLTVHSTAAKWEKLLVGHSELKLVSWKETMRVDSWDCKLVDKLDLKLEKTTVVKLGFPKVGYWGPSLVDSSVDALADRKVCNLVVLMGE